MDKGGNLSIDIVGDNRLWNESVDKYCRRLVWKVSIEMDLPATTDNLIVKGIHRKMLATTDG